MLHLSSDRLAALADDEPTAAEALHLAGCAECATERRVHQDLLIAAQDLRNAERTPLSRWESLAPALAAEGLAGTRAILAQKQSRIARVAGMAAAALLLVTGGAIAGRLSAGAAVLPVSAGAATGTSTAKLPEVVTEDERAFSSPAEALDVYFSSQRDYQRASAYLASTGGSGDEDQRLILNRVAALEEMLALSASALRTSPADPVLNDYYISTLGSREAAVKQLDRIIPVGARITHY